MHDSYSICATLESDSDYQNVGNETRNSGRKYRSKLSRLRKIFEKKILPRLNREKCNPETGPI